MLRLTNRGGFFRSASLFVCLLGIGAGCADMNTRPKPSRDAGLRLYAQGEYTDAAGAFGNAVRAEPRDYQSHYYLGQSYEAMGQNQQAIHAYKASLQTMTATMQGRGDHAFRARVLESLAAAIGKSSDPSAEITQLEQQTRQGSKVESHLLLGKVYRHAGDAELALQNYRAAATLDPTNFLVQKDLGLYLEQLGQMQDAVKPLERAYRLDPKDEEVIAALRRIGVPPGLSLQAEKDLAPPLVPKGPIPVWKPSLGDSTGPAADAPQD